MNKILGIVTCLILALTSHSQQDYQFTQFQFDRVSLNPGAVGLDENCLGFFYRNQWLNLSGDPKTMLLNYHQPVKVLKGGLGITAFQDQLGNQRTALGEVNSTFGTAIKTTAIRLSYSYHKTLGSGTLGAGLSIGYQGKSIGDNWFSIDPADQDDAIPTIQRDNAGALDLNLGVYYKTNKYWAGLSSVHLTSPELAGTTIRHDVERHYYFMAGMDQAVGSDIVLKPSVLLKSDFVSNSIDLNVLAEWKEFIWGGVGYRSQDAINPMVGVSVPLKGTDSFSQSAKIGVAYDIGISDLAKASDGGIELFVGYCWKFVPPVIRKSHGNPRFL